MRFLPPSSRRIEPWANGAGSTEVLWREPDDANWRVRISIASVVEEGPFSELMDTRRLLVPLDAPMALRFADGRREHADRFGVLRFDGAPAPFGILPEGPTHDFNLMLRADARGEVFARTLVDSQIFPPEAGARWLIYVHRGSARMVGGGKTLQLASGDAAMLDFADDPGRAAVEGGGELVLAKWHVPARA